MFQRSTVAQAVSIIVALAAAIIRQDAVYITFGIVALVGAVLVIVARRSLNQQPDQQPPFGGNSLSERINRMFQRNEEVNEMVKKAMTPAKAPAKAQKEIEVTPLQMEAVEISKLFRDAYDIPAYIDYRRQSAIIETPRNILYRIDNRRPFPMGAIMNRLDDIARDIHRYARKSKGPAVVASLIDSQPPYLAVSRQDPQPHLWANREWKRRPLTTCIGDYWDGPERTPLVLNIEGKACTIPAGLFCGQPRSGKSRTLHGALLGMLEATPPSKLHVWCVETKTDAYSIYAGLPHIQKVTGRMDDVLPILQQFEHWTTSEGAPTDGIHRLLILDEFQDLIESEEIGGTVEALIKKIMAKGPERGLRVWLATQVPDKDCYPPRLKALTAFKIACTIENDGYLKQVLGIHGANRLQPQREFIWAADGRQRTITSYWLSDDDITNEIAALRAKWGGATTITNRGRGGAEVGQPRGRAGQQPSETMLKSGAGSGADPGAGVGQGFSTRVDPIYVAKGAAFPLATTRPLTDEECLVVADLAASGLSKNQLQSHVYGGSKNSKKGACITEALQRAEVLNGKA